ncbi:hypothetical protein [Paenibacillus paeoniae]|uniref:WYL domain-containing protein n=1 Tax=Paenibacillus paeoniae TaxID=2292705 RepID=A0A371PLX7_9BACL|nr:hypothetical protein [Paenibacillus paeoniae]REK77133.1 hypothetical protein DX130_09045 [Paenibacillus paeoniae]
MEIYMGKIVQLIYIDRKKNVTIRDVRVISVKGKQFKAYCYLAEALRIFITDNVVDVEICRSVREA